MKRYIDDIVLCVIEKHTLFQHNYRPPTAKMEQSNSRASDLVPTHLPQLSLFGPDSEEDSSDESIQEDPLGAITAPLSADVRQYKWSNNLSP